MKTAKLPVQLHVGKSNPKKVMYKVINRGWGNKPEDGVWTSTWSTVAGSGWIEWCLGERYSAGLKKTGFKCQVKPSARILEVDTLEDLKEIIARYPDEKSHIARVLARDRGAKTEIDFEALANDFDGLHLTDEGQSDTRFSQPSMYGWDAESTVFFRDVFKSCKRVNLSTYCRRLKRE